MSSGRFSKPLARPRPSDDEDKENIGFEASQPKRVRREEEPGQLTSPGESVGVVQGNRTTEWLNSLDLETARELYELMKSRGGFTQQYTIPEHLRTELRGMSSKASDVRDGVWWAETFCGHSITNIRPDKNSSKGKDGQPGRSRESHPRWLFKVRASAQSSVAVAVKDILTEESWEALAALAVSSTGQVKLPVHHVAYNSSPLRVQTPLPNDLGKGSSISHLCDTIGCIDLDCLLLATNHVDNMVRQRCQGVSLVAVGSVIVMEIPCPHAIGTSTSERISLSCRRVRLIHLNNVAVDKVLWQHGGISDGTKKI